MGNMEQLVGGLILTQAPHIRSGTQADAVILAVRDGYQAEREKAGGAYSGDRGPGREPFTGKVKMIKSRYGPGHFEVGQRIAVRVDLNDPRRMVDIEWRG